VVKIKLIRMGAKKKPSYRIVIMDATKSVKSSYIDLLGTYNPLETDENKVILLDEERTLAWLRKGAQPTDKSKSLLKKVKLWEKFMSSKNKKLQREEKLNEKID
jgi:small subunit ribosomal protein S16